MSQRVQLDENGFIFQALSAQLTPEDLRDDLGGILEAQRQIQEKGQPVNVLIDASGLKKISSTTRQQGLDNLKLMQYNKIAIFGANLYVRHLANFVLAASGRGKNIKMFDNKDQAIEWLRT